MISNWLNFFGIALLPWITRISQNLLGRTQQLLNFSNNIQVFEFSRIFSCVSFSFLLFFSYFPIFCEFPKFRLMLKFILNLFGIFPDLYSFSKSPSIFSHISTLRTYSSELQSNLPSIQFDPMTSAPNSIQKIMPKSINTTR